LKGPRRAGAFDVCAAADLAGRDATIALEIAASIMTGCAPGAIPSRTLMLQQFV
jgi:hypothetical protein